MSKEETFWQWLRRIFGYKSKLWTTVKHSIEFPIVEILCGLFVVLSFGFWFEFFSSSLIFTVMGILVQIIYGSLIILHGFYRMKDYHLYSGGKK